MKNEAWAMFRMPIMPNTMVRPDATRKSSIPYASPCMPWATYIAVVGSTGVSFPLNAPRLQWAPEAGRDPRSICGRTYLAGILTDGPVLAVPSYQKYGGMLNDSFCLAGGTYSSTWRSWITLWSHARMVSV